MSKINTHMPVLMIVGMHRSGTSCLTGSLQQKNVFLGEVHEKNPFNLKGNRENQSIVDLNDDVLSLNDSAWDVPPNGSISWDENLAGRRDDIIVRMDNIAQQQGSSYWGFKDPRALLVLPFWQDGLSSLNFVGTFRHPVSVAMSLNKRSGMSLDSGVALWKRYNQQLVDLYRVQKFPLICFDVDNSTYVEDLDRVFEEIGLVSSEHSSDFFTPDLRKNNDNLVDYQLPEDVSELYAKLLDFYHSQDK